MERHRGLETHMNVSFIEMQFTAESSFSRISCFRESDDDDNISDVCVQYFFFNFYSNMQMGKIGSIYESFVAALSDGPK